MKIDIDNLTVGRRPSNIQPQTGTGRKRRKLLIDGQHFQVAVCGGSKSIWIKYINRDWIAIQIDDLAEALAPILKDLSFTPYEEPRGSKGIYVDK